MVVEPDEDAWHAYCPALQAYGAATWGTTRAEALRHIREVVALVVAELIEDGEAVPADVEGSAGTRAIFASQSRPLVTKYQHCNPIEVIVMAPHPTAAAAAKPPRLAYVPTSPEMGELMHRSFVWAEQRGEIQYVVAEPGMGLVDMIVQGRMRAPDILVAPPGGPSAQTHSKDLVW